MTENMHNHCRVLEHQTHVGIKIMLRGEMLFNLKAINGLCVAAQCSSYCCQLGQSNAFSKPTKLYECAWIVV